MNRDKKKISNDVWQLIDWILDVRNIEVEQSVTASKVCTDSMAC
jgi:hypothetical protein